MPLAHADTIEGALLSFCRGRDRSGLPSEIVAKILPVIPGLIVRPESAAGIVSTVDHAVLATRITRHAVHHAVFVPRHLLEQFGVGTEMTVGHQVAGPFPSAN